MRSKTITFTHLRGKDGKPLEMECPDESFPRPFLGIEGMRQVESIDEIRALGAAAFERLKRLKSL